MSNREPVVSIIIPTYYRNDWLPRAIESATAQTYEPTEIIVVDDSGERFAEDVVKEYDVKYVPHEENQGGNPARNTGIEAAAGEYIQFLDDDDVLHPEKLEKQVALLEESPSVDVVYSGIRQEDESEVLPDPADRGDVLAKLLQFDIRPCQTTTMLFDGDLLRDLHPLATREAADDIGLKIRAAERTNFDFVGEVLVAKGKSEEQRQHKIGFSDELGNMIEEFDHLYAQFDETVRRNAMTRYYRTRAHRLMQNRTWSPEAISLFGKALYHERFRDPVLFGAFVSSLLGNPGYKFSQKLRRVLE